MDEADLNIMWNRSYTDLLVANRFRALISLLFTSLLVVSCCVVGAITIPEVPSSFVRW